MTKAESGKERLIVARAQLDAHFYAESMAMGPENSNYQPDGVLVISCINGQRILDEAFKYLGITDDPGAKLLYLATMASTIEQAKAYSSP